MRTTVTRQYLESRITDVEYSVMSGTTMTVCLLRMANDYTVLGKSACAHPANFDAALGRKYAYEDAIDKLWPLEGYLLAEELSRVKVGKTAGQDWCRNQIHNAGGEFSSGLQSNFDATSQGED